METYQLYNTSFSWGCLKPGDQLCLHTLRNFVDVASGKNYIYHPRNGVTQCIVIAIQNRETKYGMGLFITLLCTQGNNRYELFTFRKAAIHLRICILVERPPKFHVLNRYHWPSGDILPGDAAISPGITAWHLSNGDITQQRQLAHAAFFIIGVVVSGLVTTYYIYTRHGIMIVLKDQTISPNTK